MGFVPLAWMWAVPGRWDHGSGTAYARERLTALPLLTAAVLLLPSPFLAPVVVHDMAGRRTEAVVVAVDRSDEERTGAVRHRVADRATEQDLGPLVYGLPGPVPDGAVVEVSVVPGGWAGPIAVERLAADVADVQREVLGALLALHGLAAVAAWVLWPREVDW